MNSWLELVVFLLAVYGMSFTIVDSSILSTHIPLRKLWIKVPFFRDLFSCYFCTGIWSAAFLYYFKDVHMVQYIFAGAVVTYFLNKLEEGAICVGCKEKIKELTSKNYVSDRAMRIITKGKSDV